MNEVHPDFLEQLKDLLPAGEVDQFLDTCFAPLKKSITVNTAKISVEKFIEITQECWWHLTPSPFVKDPISFYIDRDTRPLPLGKTFLHQCGFFYIQEIAASLPATQIYVSAGQVILDMAAAPGGKASQLANSLLQSDHPGIVIANDVNKQRIKPLAHNLNKWWCYNTALSAFNGFMFGKHLTNFFDHVLLDAPCSGEWTWYKSDVAMKYRNQAEINKIAWTQFQLLVSAVKATKPGGTIVYSTCTINPYENEQIVAKILDFFNGSVELTDLSLQEVSEGYPLSEEFSDSYNHHQVARLRPHLHHTGWFFIAKLRKLTATNENEDKERDHKLLPKNQFKIDQSKNLQWRVQAWLKEEFWITIDQTRHRFMATKDNLYLISPELKDISGQINFEKMWIPIAKTEKDYRRPTHYLGNILGTQATKNVIILDDETMQTYTNGDSFLYSKFPTIKETKSRYRIIKRKDRWMSVGKIVGDEVKNKFM